MLALLFLVLAPALHAPASGQAPAADPADLAQALEALEAPDSDVRRVAEAWLARNLAVADEPEVSRALRTRGAEVRGRIVSALGSDDRGIGLAAALAAETEPHARAAGEEALRRRIAAWLSTDDLLPGSFAIVAGTVDPRFARRRRLQVAGTPLALLADRLDRAIAARAERAAPAPVGLVLDPRLAAEGLRLVPRKGSDTRGVELEGDVLEITAGLAAGFDLEVEVYGLRGPSPWLFLHRRELTAPPAGELVVSWMRELSTRLDPARRRRAARALASSGWPGGLAWMAELWRTHQDPAAFHGLVVAAGRGRVAPVLTGAAGFAELLQELDRAAGERPDRAEADRLARAIGAIGPLGSDGSDLAALAASGVELLPAPVRARRLDVLAQMGGAPAGLVERLRAELAGRAEIPATCLWPAARVLAGAEPEPFEVRDPGPLLQAGRREERDDLAAADRLERAGARPPASWQDAGGIPAGDRVLAALWWAGAGDEEAAARCLALALADSGGDGRRELQVGDLLAGLARRGRAKAVRGILAAAFGPDRERASLRLSVLAGVATPSERARLLEKLAESETASDWAVLGALAGASDGAAGARARLFSEAGAAAARDRSPAAAWTFGVERAYQVALQRDDEAAAGEIERAAGTVLRAADHPLLERFQLGQWPAGPGAAELLE